MGGSLGWKNHDFRAVFRSHFSKGQGSKRLKVISYPKIWHKLPLRLKKEVVRSQLPNVKWQGLCDLTKKNKLHNSCCNYVTILHKCLKGYNYEVMTFYIQKDKGQLHRNFIILSKKCLRNSNLTGIWSHTGTYVEYTLKWKRVKQQIFKSEARECLACISR